MTLQLNMVSRLISIISVYELTLTALDDLKDNFYDELRTAICKIPICKMLGLALTMPPGPTSSDTMELEV